ncbi:MAG TPA: TlpA disulfide reductase family protein [Fimbriimonadaceae bacterium]|jgi:thiol-disulfide isomerase/thioredoxin
MQKLALSLVVIASAAAAMANSKGDKLVSEIDSLQRPAYDKSKDTGQAYRDEYKAKFIAFQTHKNELIEELYKTDPDNAKTADLMVSRWMQFKPGTRNDSTVVKDAEKDIDKTLADNPPLAIKEAAEYSRVMLDSALDPKNLGPSVDAYVAKYPKSSYAPDMLFSETFSIPEDQRTKIYRELVAQYPDYKNIGMVKGALAQTDLMGKPIPLSFDDAIGGSHIDLASMKGKVVLLDFWATWCGPCVAEMPTVKDIYAKNHSKGLEILGISLDQSPTEHGLDKLKDFVAKNQIPWPMYYQGNFWDSKFSSSLGIMEIPTMFVIDKQGNYQGTIDPRSPDFQAKLDKYMNQ